MVETMKDISIVNESPRSKLRGIKTFCSVLLLAASRGELYPKLD